MIKVDGDRTIGEYPKLMISTETGNIVLKTSAREGVYLSVSCDRFNLGRISTKLHTTSFVDYGGSLTISGVLGVVKPTKSGKWDY
jgi:glucokinase